MEHVLLLCSHIPFSRCWSFGRPFRCGGGGGGGGGGGLLFSVIAGAKIYYFICSMDGLVCPCNLAVFLGAVAKIVKSDYSLLSCVCLSVRPSS